MEKINFEEFKNEIARNIRKYLPGEYESSQVHFNTVEKNNETLESVTITSPELGNIIPNIYINDFYSDYRNGRDMDSIMKQIADIRVKNEVHNNFDVSRITDFSRVKDKIAARVVGMENNAKLLAQRPYRQMDDIAVIYCVMLGENAGGVMSVPVTNMLMETWEITKDELHKLALANLPKLTPSTFVSMNELMAEMMLPEVMSNMGVDRETAEEMIHDMVPPENMMYVLSNKQRLDGAAAILDSEIMHQVQEKIGNDFYILPSSIHEVLVIPADAYMDFRELEAMVKEVNAAQVAPQERLSDHVYRYDGGIQEIYRADKAEEHRKEYAQNRVRRKSL